MLLAVGSIAPAWAQDYPSRSITVIVPFPAGGASDVVARIVTDQMSKLLKQSMVIENVGGAGGTVVAPGPPLRRPMATPSSPRRWLARGSAGADANLKYDPATSFVRSASPPIRRRW